VQFNVQETESLSWATVRDTGWEWDFDDDSIVDATGYMAYHVFESAGVVDVHVREDGG
jgi:PKD repeat protein